VSNRNCPVCGASWINDQLFWKTGKPGKNEDLNALVCRQLEGLKFNSCANPCKGQPGGIGWEERLKMMEQGLDGL
jgi:hypothetical protein